MEQEVMQAIRAELESNIDAKYREFHSSLVPGQNCRILGVRIPVSRRIAKAIARDHYEVYTEQFNPEVYEELLIRGMMIGYGKLTREEQTAELDCFVPMINSWGICDSSCATCHFMKKDQEYWYGYLYHVVIAVHLPLFPFHPTSSAFRRAVLLRPVLSREVSLL